MVRDACDFDLGAFTEILEPDSFYQTLMSEHAALILLGLAILFSMLIIVDRDRFFGGSETPWVMAQAVLGFLIIALAALAVWWAPEP